MNVHNKLGMGFQEMIYQRAMAFEFEASNLDYLEEVPYDIYYDGKLLGQRRADFVVEDQVIVELKAVFEIKPEHFIQTRNYIMAFEKPVGLLLNFGSRSLVFKKIYNPNLNIEK